MTKPDNLCISAEELNRKRIAKESFVLVDVRSPAEHAAHNIGGLLIPIAELSQRHSELNPDDDIVLYCHSGQRSLYAAEFLRSLNFKSVKSLAGGLQMLTQ